jgi:uncharacterized protein
MSSLQSKENVSMKNEKPMNGNSIIQEEFRDLSVISREERAALSSSGVIFESEKRSATFILKNLQAAYFVNNSRKFVILPLFLAMKYYPWIKEKYYFKAVPNDYDDIVRSTGEQIQPMGCFIHVKQGEKVTLPCQVGMMMSTENLTQIVHNIVILEEDSELNLLTSCLSTPRLIKGRHIAISEHYVGKGAKLISTMLHSWGPEVIVNPISGTIVEENGKYENNYISLRPAKEITSNPQTFLNGKAASAKYLTVVLSIPGSTINTGGNVYLNAEDTSAELAHRGVCTGGAIYQTGLLIANAKCHAHVDCAGMLLNASADSLIQSVPGLQSHHPDARMSHEASIGRISPEQVEYLMCKGMDEREAISLLIRGFIGADITGISPEIDEQISKISEIAGHGEE